MGRLVTLVADRTRSTTVVHGVFDPPVVIGARPKIGLQSLQVNPLRVSNEIIPIESGKNRFKLNGEDLLFPQGNYYITTPGTPNIPSTFMSTINENTDFPPPSPGDEFIVTYDANGRLVLTRTLYASEQPVPAAGTWAKWIVESGAPDLTVAGVFNANLSVGAVKVTSQDRLPSRSNSIEMRMTTLDEFALTVPNWLSFGIDNAGQYVVSADLLDNVYPGPIVFVAANPPAVGDIITITKTVGLYNINVANAGLGKDEILNFDIPFDSQLAYDKDIVSGFIVGQVEITAPAGSSATFDLDLTLTSNTVDPASIVLNFTSPSLASYLGSVVNPTPVINGTPAVMTFRSPVSAGSNPGVRVCISNVRVASHSGDSRPLIGVGYDGCIKLIHSDGPIIIDQVITDAIDIESLTGLTISQMDMTFRDETNGKPLEFQGIPAASLMFYSEPIG